MKRLEIQLFIEIFTNLDCSGPVQSATDGLCILESACCHSSHSGQSVEHVDLIHNRIESMLNEKKKGKTNSARRVNTS